MIRRSFALPEKLPRVAPHICHLSKAQLPNEVPTLQLVAFILIAAIEPKIKSVKDSNVTANIKRTVPSAEQVTDSSPALRKDKCLVPDPARSPE